MYHYLRFERKKEKYQNILIVRFTVKVFMSTDILTYNVIVYIYRRALLGLNLRKVFHSVEVEEIKDQKLACEREMAVDPRDQEYDLLQIWNLKYEEVNMM